MYNEFLKVVVRKSIVAKTANEQGECFSVDNLTVKRPGDGISPMRWYDVIGKKQDGVIVKMNKLEKWSYDEKNSSVNWNSGGIWFVETDYR